MNYTLNGSKTLWEIFDDTGTLEKVTDHRIKIPTIVIQNKSEDTSIWIDTFQTPAVGTGIELASGKTLSVDALSIKDITLTSDVDIIIGINAY